MIRRVDDDTCTRCGICSQVCPMGIISPPVGGAVPRVQEENAGVCISCGQCDAFCPTGALTQEQPSSPRENAWNGSGITPEDLSIYLRSRRSIRQFTSEPVSRETVEALLNIARYAASGGNGQPVEWLVLHDPSETRKIAGLVIDWMETLVSSTHPMSKYVPSLISAWKGGTDPICRGAPHLLIPHIPKENPLAPTDAIIALTHVDIAGPVFGVGTCWGGFIAMAFREYVPLLKAFDLPDGRIPAYALMFGKPRYKPVFIPERKPLNITWR